MARRVSDYEEPKTTPRKRKGQARRGGDDADEDVFRSNQIRWWREPNGDRAAGELWAWISRLRLVSNESAIYDLIQEAIYNDEVLGSGDMQNPESSRMSWLGRSRTATANLNICKQKVDASTARLTKRRPMPVISADDAGWSEKQFAKRCSRTIRRKMGGSYIEKRNPLWIRDFHIRGTSVSKNVRWNIGDVRPERHPIYEFVWDPDEAAYGEPQTMAQVKPVNRDLLLEAYPKYTKQILAAPPFARGNPWSTYVYRGPGRADLIEVAEAWHLPSGPNADDGQHIIAIHGFTILREPWMRPRFPVAMAYWCPPQRGLRGSSLVSELAGIQSKITDTLKDIEETIAYSGKLRLFVQRGSNLIKNHLRARGAAVIEIDGQAPQFAMQNPQLQEAIGYVQLLLQKADDLSGFNQLALSGKNILGSNASGKAIDTMDDIQSDRFAHVETGWMQFRVDQAMLMIDEARCMCDEAYSKPKKLFDEQPAPIDKHDLAAWIREIDWRKIDIDSGDYHLTIEPINFLPDSRAGKLSAVKELSAAGLIPDPSMTADLFDEPDIARANRTILGPKHNLDRCMEGLSDPDVPYIDVTPDPYMNLALGVMMAQGELNDAQAHTCVDDDDREIRDEVCERYRTWIEDAKQLIDRAKNAASLPGAQANNIVAQPNAQTLQPGLGAGGPPMPPDAGGGMPPMPPGGMPS